MLLEETTVTIDEKEYKISVSEDGNLVSKAESVVDNVVDSVESWYESAKDVLKSGFEWIMDLFKSDPQLAKFIWANGSEVIFRYDEKTNEIEVDTSYFDSISDGNVETKFSLWEATKWVKSLAEAKKIIETKKWEIEKYYNGLVTSNAIDNVTTGEWRQYNVIEQFIVSEWKEVKEIKEGKKWERMDVALVKDVDTNWNIDSVKVNISTTNDDDVWDSDTAITIDHKKPITKEVLEEAINSAKIKYIDKVAEVKKDELKEEEAKAAEKAKEAKQAEEAKANEKAEQAKAEKQEKAEAKEKEDIKEIKSEINKLKLTASDIKPKGVDENKWVKWTSEFSTSPEFGLDINNIDMKTNKINIDFDDSWGNEGFNKGLIIDWVINKDWKLDVKAFKNALPIKVAEAIKKMIDAETNKEKKK